MNIKLSRKWEPLQWG